MSIWARISQALAALAKGEALSSVFDRLRTPPERSVAFTIAVIALGAKMAKADGQVTRDEVSAFRQVFHIAPQDEAQAARVFNLARQDVAGFEEYAQKIRAMFDQTQGPLCDLLEGLFFIAMADGTYHPREDAFLARVGHIFGLSEAQFAAMRARFVPDAPPDPYSILGLAPGRLWPRRARRGNSWCAKTTPIAWWRGACRKRRSKSPSGACMRSIAPGKRFPQKRLKPLR